MEMSKGVSLLRTAQSLLTGRTIYAFKYFSSVFYATARVIRVENALKRHVICISFPTRFSNVQSNLTIDTR